MRVYLPVTNVIAGRLVDSGGLDGPVTGFAVTPALREHYADSNADTDLEELEYAALTLAARGSLRLIDADPGSWRRRMVLSADVPDGQVEIRDDLDAGVVRLADRVGLDQVASVHVDDLDATHTIGVAAVAILQADLGDESAQDAVDDAEGNELSWYATQELAGLLELD